MNNATMRTMCRKENRKITPLSLYPSYGVDEKGFLYKWSKTKYMFIAMRPILSRFNNNNCYFRVKIDGKDMKFFQEELVDKMADAKGVYL